MKQIDVAQFWSETESRIGEKVLINSLGQVLRGGESVHPGTWGLFFISESALHFQTFPNENWFSALFRGSRNARRSVEELSFFIPFAQIQRTNLSTETSLLRRIFAPRPPVVEINYEPEAGELEVLQFAMDLRVREFYRVLEERTLRSP